MRNYEVAVVLHPDLEIDLAATLEKIEAVFTKNGAKINKKDNWGKRKLAYTIKKQDWGIYVIYEISIDPSKVSKINQVLRITEEVMRYLVVSLENIRYITVPSKTSQTKPVAQSKPEVTMAEKPLAESEAK
ncbi:30S ribosomal protein S6 [Patescibacteria group bacterium]|nr:30S ribosomal protein S6 [Patescibacteria group bacterium]